MHASLFSNFFYLFTVSMLFYSISPSNYAALLTAYILCNFATYEETGSKDVMFIISTLPAHLWKKEKYIVLCNIKTSTALELKSFIDQIQFKSIPEEYYITSGLPDNLGLK